MVLNTWKIPSCVDILALDNTGWRYVVFQMATLTAVCPARTSSRHNSDTHTYLATNVHVSDIAFRCHSHTVLTERGVFACDSFCTLHVQAVIQDTHTYAQTRTRLFAETCAWQLQAAQKMAFMHIWLQNDNLVKWGLIKALIFNYENDGWFNSFFFAMNSMETLIIVLVVY